MSTDVPAWSSDVPISIPHPPSEAILVSMFGFGVTQLGIVHDLTEVEYDYLRTPSYSPDLPNDDTIFDDEGLR
jgi:hypothetical protein